jgi:hypothetical protein
LKLKRRIDEKLSKINATENFVLQIQGLTFVFGGRRWFAAH